MWKSIKHQIPVQERVLISSFVQNLCDLDKSTEFVPVLVLGCKGGTWEILI